MTAADDLAHAEEIRSIVRWSGCPAGCGDYHECGVGDPLPDPQLFIDRAGQLHWVPAPRRPEAFRARAGHCIICADELDRNAIRLGDNRCTRCWKRIAAERRRTHGGRR